MKSSKYLSGPAAGGLAAFLRAPLQPPLNSCYNFTIMSTPITAISGIQQTRAKQLEALGVYCAEDLLTLYPRGYEQRTNVKKICEITAEDVSTQAAITLIGTVSDVKSKYIRANLTITSMRLHDMTGSVTITMFNQAYNVKKLHPNQKIAVFGNVTRGAYSLEINNPVFTTKPDTDEDFFKIKAIYPLSAGLSQNFMRKIVKNAFAITKAPQENLPAEILEKRGFPTKKTALINIHFPKNEMEIHAARKRLVYEELFIIQLMLMLIKTDKKTTDGAISFAGSDNQIIEKFINSLPFELTLGQKLVWQEIAIDMDSQKSMNRLVLGDVGSGKTVVAVLAMLKAILCGYTAVFMAPTEILARQHYNNISKMLEKITLPGGEKIRTTLLTGSLPLKEKRQALDDIRQGFSHIVIGTHALIQAGVTFHRPGIVITDEQHRFGVKQREILQNSDENISPDVLVMSATPIPRTLALVLYGDLDISTLKGKPSERKPVITLVRQSDARENIYKWATDQIMRKKAQVYIVHPLIEQGESNMLSAEENYKKMTTDAASPFVEKNISTGLVHGKMSAKDKAEVMENFVSGKTSVLFSTTVIEVGVDVANATIMIIENAERFGLAQLHQLRGRVGRGADQSYCVLVTEASDKPRMKIMEESNDGFEISEKDLELRGPGDFFGTQQSGLPPFRIANLYSDTDILKEAQKDALLIEKNMSRYDDYIKYIKSIIPAKISL